jgi:hypothetical protein
MVHVIWYSTELTNGVPIQKLPKTHGVLPSEGKMANLSCPVRVSPMFSFSTGHKLGPTTCEIADQMPCNI